LLTAPVAHRNRHRQAYALRREGGERRAGEGSRRSSWAAEPGQDAHSPTGGARSGLQAHARDVRAVEDRRLRDRLAPDLQSRGFGGEGTSHRAQGNDGEVPVSWDCDLPSQQGRGVQRRERIETRRGRAHALHADGRSRGRARTGVSTAEGPGFGPAAVAGTEDRQESGWDGVRELLLDARDGLAAILVTGHQVTGGPGDRASRRQEKLEKYKDGLDTWQRLSDRFNLGYRS